jgi:hypothetical protein
MSPLGFFVPPQASADEGRHVAANTHRPCRSFPPGSRRAEEPKLAARLTQKGADTEPSTHDHDVVQGHADQRQVLGRSRAASGVSSPVER